jgi:uncharacterized membrane protein YccC
MVFKTFINIERLIHATKTAIACIIGFLLARFIGLPADQWIVITIIVVMCSQIYVGSVLQKAYLRLLGTLIGCLFAAVTLVTAGHSGIAIAAAIGISSFIFSYMAVSRENLSYAGTLGAVTTAIIMLGQTPTILFAVERFLEISIGIFIATIVSQFVLPINARTHLRRAQGNTLGQLIDYYTAAMMTKNDGALEKDFHELDERIVKSLLRQRQLAKESASERLGSVFDRAHFMQSLYYERELLRAMTFMHNAKSNIRNADYVLINSPAGHVFNETVLQSLKTIINAIESDRPEREHIHLPSLEGLKEELQKNLESPSRDQLIYIDGFLFCAELLTKGLGMLAELYKIQIYRAPSNATPV